MLLVKAECADITDTSQPLTAACTHVHTQVRYVIDFYAGVPRPGGPPAAMFLDVRPALDSVGAAWDRLTMQVGG
jgi:hypothetical protein